MPTELPSEADIDCPARTIFDIIVDLDHQSRWLSQSSAFKGTREISDDPINLGTTYREPGPAGVRNGVVTELEPPTTITFHQPMTLKLHAGVLDMTLRYTLTPRGDRTHVRRVCTLTVPTHLALLKPLLTHAFRVESARTLQALKTYADAFGKAPS